MPHIPKAETGNPRILPLSLFHPSHQGSLLKFQSSALSYPPPNLLLQTHRYIIKLLQKPGMILPHLRRQILREVIHHLQAAIQETLEWEKQLGRQ